MNTFMKWSKRALGGVFLSYGAWVQVTSHFDGWVFLLGTILEVLGIGLIMGWRREKGAK